MKRCARPRDLIAIPVLVIVPGRVSLRFEEIVMTHCSSDDDATPRPASILNCAMLDTQIARRRMAIAALEAEMTAACEAAAFGARLRTLAPADHADWDRTALQRYLAAAMRLEPDYGPRMRRLRQEIGQLERLKTLPIAA